VVDAEQVVPATFENFIWFSDTELVEGVHAAIPLFKGSVPLTGDLADQITAALDSMLKQKGIAGHAVSMMQGTLSGQLQHMQFKVEGIDVKITEVRFPGASPDHTRLLQAATKVLIGEDYLRSNVAETVKRSAPGVYGRLGFLKAQFGAPKPVILQDDSSHAAIALEIPVQEGDQYTFAALTCTGASMVPSVELERNIGLKAGAVADTGQLARGIAAVKDLYGSKGYMYAQVRSTAVLDAEKHTARFNLEVKEGPIYHMGKLEIQGLEPERTQLVRKVWGLREGDVYDASYPPGFLKKHPRELAALDGWAARFTQTINDDTHVVDLSFKFEKFQREAR
jgi:outer membrane protein insertion porin family